MYELKIISQFAAAHQLREFHGACENLHGHNWKVEVHVQGAKLGNEGILLDFREIKQAAKEAVDELDHRFLNEVDAFENINPSSENIARHIFERLSKKLNGKDVRVSKITVWESDNASASFTEAR